MSNSAEMYHLTCRSGIVLRKLDGVMIKENYSLITKFLCAISVCKHLWTTTSLDVRIVCGVFCPQAWTGSCSLLYSLDQILGTVDSPLCF